MFVDFEAAWPPANRGVQLTPLTDEPNCSIVHSSPAASCLFDGLNTRRARDNVEPDLGLFESHLQNQEQVKVFV